MLLRSLAVTLAAATVLVAVSIASAAPDTGPTARAARTFHRCGTFRDRNSPYGGPKEDEYGVYILQGRVSCINAIEIQTAVFAGKGEGLQGPASAYVFYRGWYCNGQMGGYTCQNALEHPGKRFAVLACSAPNIGCPVTDSHLGS